MATAVPCLRLRHLNRIIGKEATAALVKERGGRRMYVPNPETLRETHWLCRLIGKDAAQALCREYRGVRDLRIPQGIRRRHKRLHQKVRQLRAKAIPVASIAMRLRCSEKAVYSALHAIAFDCKNSPQLDMFYFQLDLFDGVSR